MIIFIFSSYKTSTIGKTSSVIYHKGQKIVFTDLSGLNEQEILKGLEESKDLVLKENVKLLIVDVTNTTTTKTIKEKASGIISDVEQNVGKFHSSLIGLRLAQQVIANLINRDQYFASNIEDAKEWLAKKASKL